MKRIYESQIIFISLLLTSIFSAGCSQVELKSTWRQNEISIDGSKSDWVGKLQYFEDEKVAAAIANDSENVYFCFATADNSKIMKILRMGFTVWLDPQESDGKTIGIQYPIKRESAVMLDGALKDHDNSQNRGFEINKMINKLKAEQNELLIVNENNFPLNAYPLDNHTGLNVRMGYEINQLVYELKIPLANNKISNIYIDALPKEKIKVGFESGEFERPEQGDRNSSGMRPQGGGMSGSGRKRGGGRSNMENMQEITKQIKFWMEVKLASQN